MKSTDTFKKKPKAVTLGPKPARANKLSGKTRSSRRRAPTTVGQRLLKFAGTVSGSPADMARNHDHYIHGAPRK